MHRHREYPSRRTVVLLTICAALVIFSLTITALSMIPGIAK